mgnify:CR=1 FL=1
MSRRCVFLRAEAQQGNGSSRKVAAYYGVRLLEQDIAGIMSYSNCSLLAASSEAIEHKATRSSWLSMAKVR